MARLPLTRKILVEVHHPGGWVWVGAVGEGDPPGSIGSQTPLGRQVYMFGWWKGRPGVWLAPGSTMENRAVRVLGGEGISKLSDLSEPYETHVYMGSGVYEVRFSRVDE